MPFVSTRPALQLTKDELEDLEKASRSRTQSQRTVERAKILLEYYRRKSISQIARELETNRPKVERVINKAFAYGIYIALEDIPRSGRSRRISSDARTWIISLACTKPLKYGYSYEDFDLAYADTGLNSHVNIFNLYGLYSSLFCSICSPDRNLPHFLSIFVFFR